MKQTLQIFQAQVKIINNDIEKEKVCDNKLVMIYDINGYTGTVNRLMMRQTEKGEKGLQVFDNGDVYEGEFLNDMMHGQGTYTCKNGNIISGQFIKNQFTGKGTIEYKDNNKETICDGNFINGQLDGQCKICYKNDDTFQGVIKNNYIQSGSYISNNNIEYNGQFSNQQFNGKGKFVSDQVFVQGEFQNNFLKDGKITKQYKLYTIKYNGQLSNGICQGFGKSKLYLNKSYKKLLKQRNGQFKNNTFISNKQNQKQQKSDKKH